MLSTLAAHRYYFVASKTHLSFLFIFCYFSPSLFSYIAVFEPVTHLRKCSLPTAWGMNID